MILGRRWSQRGPRAVEHLVRPLPQDADRLVFDVLGVVEVDLRRGPSRRRSYVRHQRRESVVVERLGPPVEEVGAALALLTTSHPRVILLTRR
jgi:hypothetical protein